MQYESGIAFIDYTHTVGLTQCSPPFFFNLFKMNLKQNFIRQGAAELLRHIKMTPAVSRLEGIAQVISAIDDFEITDPRQWAYILATVQHESGFECIPERKAKAGTEIWEKYQKKYWPSGFYGRGYCQLTWDYNYRKFGELLKIDLYNQPDLALDPAISANILVLGMKNGLFSGKKLDQYIIGSKCDFVGARKIVNGTFKAAEVADKAQRILDWLI